MNVATRTRLENAAYPEMMTRWEPYQLGWRGIAQVWANGNEKTGREHEIYVGVTSPLGRIVVHLNGHEYGAWASVDLYGDTITNRDLQWAAAWAAAIIKLMPDDIR